MPEVAPGTEILSLANDFPPVPTSEWEEAIRKDLKGADYEKKLVWKTDEGIAVRPYYRAEDVVDARRPVRGAAGDQGACPVVRVDEIHERGGSAVHELAHALAEGGKHSGRVELVFAIGPAYFMEIAKFRAARLMWPNPDVRITARTPLRNKSIYDRYNNLLRVTTEAAAALVGGCDQVIIEAFGFDPHLALNVERILREEAHLDAVEDPAGGSYFVESLTASLIHEARKLYQQMQADPGILDRAVEQNRAALQQALAARRRTLVGVNNYPDRNETGVPEPAGEFRLALPFEEIRRRTERHTPVPEVLLLKRGDLKMRMARANFCLNFFGCAGFHITESEEYAGKQADLIVLCSSDPEYLDLALEVCPKVSAPVIVAGNPKDRIEALKAAGVQGFVHMQSDAVETLTYWQDRLGMRKLS